MNDMPQVLDLIGKELEFLQLFSGMIVPKYC